MLTFRTSLELIHGFTRKAKLRIRSSADHASRPADHPYSAQHFSRLAAEDAHDAGTYAALAATHTFALHPELREFGLPIPAALSEEEIALLRLPRK